MNNEWIHTVSSCQYVVKKSALFSDRRSKIYNDLYFKITTNLLVDSKLKRSRYIIPKRLLQRCTGPAHYWWSVVTHSGSFQALKDEVSFTGFRYVHINELSPTKFWHWRLRCCIAAKVGSRLAKGQHFLECKAECWWWVHGIAFGRRDVGLRPSRCVIHWRREGKASCGCCS